MKPDHQVGRMADGTPVFEIPQLSWEERALLAEEKLQALVDGLTSREDFERLLLWNPLARSIATLAIQLHEAQLHEADKTE